MNDFLSQSFRTSGRKETTLRIGGEFDMIRPGSVEALGDLLIHAQSGGIPYSMLGNGSNSVFRDEPGAGIVISTKKCNGIKDLGGNRVLVEAGVMVPSLVRRMRDHGLGGCEFLVSVPGTVGGCVVMNSGSGRKGNKFFERIIESVAVICNGRRQILSRNACGFGYRDSIFHRNPSITVVAVVLRMQRKRVVDITDAILKRIEQANIYYDNSCPNAGSIYVSPPAHLPHISGPVEWSSKTPNWLLNKGDGKFSDLVKCLPYERDLELCIMP